MCRVRLTGALTRTVLATMTVSQRALEELPLINDRKSVSHPHDSDNSVGGPPEFLNEVLRKRGGESLIRLGC